MNLRPFSGMAAAILLTGCAALIYPTNRITRKEATPGFDLQQLHQEPTLVWPIQSEDVRGFVWDDLLPETGSKASYLAKCSGRLSENLLAVLGPGSLGADRTVELLASEPATGKYLHPISAAAKETTLDVAGFSGNPKTSRFKFAIIPVALLGDWGVGDRPVVFLHIRLVVVDLKSGSIVWKGQESGPFPAAKNHPFSGRIGSALAEKISPK